MKFLPAAAALLFPVTALAQGDINPPAGAPTASMKTLTQVEPRTPISGITLIGVKGSYSLTGNITVASGNAITINTAGVTLDLNGFTIESTSATPSGTAISVNASDVTILNGHISGTGFVNGIYSANTSYNSLTARHMTVRGCQERGIVFVSTETTMIDTCTVQTITSVSQLSSRGLQARVVKNSSAEDCSFAGISGDVITGCRAVVNASAPASSVAISGDAVSDCYAEIKSTSASSTGIAAETASNCKAIAIAGDAISSSVASHCNGYSTSGEGVFAFSISNCYGYSVSGTPLQATGVGNVSFSHASRGSAGTGIQAFTAVGCTVQGTGVTVSATNKSLGTP